MFLSFVEVESVFLILFCSFSKVGKCLSACLMSICPIILQQAHETELCLDVPVFLCVFLLLNDLHVCSVEKVPAQHYIQKSWSSDV